MPNLVAIINCVDIYHGQTNTVINKNSKLRHILVGPYCIKMGTALFKWKLYQQKINKKPSCRYRI